MLILGLDTATEQVGAALLDADADAEVARAVHLGPMAHGEQLAPLVAEVLASAGIAARDLAAVAVGRGPGPYTGLRVGLVHAEVLGWALGIPVHGVCSLDVLAAEAAPLLGCEFLAVTDARRREVYWARYGPEGQRLAGPGVAAPAEVAEWGLPAVGAGAARHAADFARRSEPLYPDPAVLARLGARLLRSGAQPQTAPLYLRRPDAVAGGPRKRVTPS